MNGLVRKSYVSGKWVKATELTAEQMKKIKGPTHTIRSMPEYQYEGGKLVRGMSKPRQVRLPKIYGSEMNQAKLLEQKRNGPARARVESNIATARDIKNQPLEEGMNGFTVRIGGKSSGTSHAFVRPGAPESTHVHEGAHASPRRSSWRLHGQISGNPTKAMREESRADYIASGHYEDLPARKKGILAKQPSRTLYQQAARVQAAADRGEKVKDLAAYQGSIGAYATASNPIMGMTAAGRESGKKAIHAYSEVQDRMKAAGAGRRIVVPAEQTAKKRRNPFERKS